MERSSESEMISVVAEWQKSARAAATAMSSAEGRWAMLTTSLTAVIAGSIAWLAVGAMPPTNASMTARSNTTLLPYELFQRLAHSGRESSLASLNPFGSPATKSLPRNPGTRLDEALAAERAGDDANEEPGVEVRTITMDRGDTLAGALEDSGISSDDANAAVAALGKVYNSRSLRAGQSFELTYATDPQATSSAGDSGNITLGGADEDDSNANGTLEPATTTPVSHLLSVTF